MKRRYARKHGADRRALQLSLETIPQSVLQLYIYLSLSSSQDDRAAAADADLLAPGGNATSTPPVTLDSAVLPLISTSLALSFLNLAKCTVGLYFDARKAGVGMTAHMWQQMELGRGLPLHGERRAAPLEP